MHLLATCPLLHTMFDTPRNKEDDTRVESDESCVRSQRSTMRIHDSDVSKKSPHNGLLTSLQSSNTS